MKQIFTLFFVLALYLLPASSFAQVIDMEPDEIRTRQIKSVLITSTPYISGKVQAEKARSEAYTFDRIGQLVGRVSYTDGAPSNSAFFRYDENGNRVFHEITVHALRKTPNVSYEYEYENGRIVREENSNTSLKRLFTYDEYGHVIREELRDANHTLVESIRYEYDSEGNRITELHDLEYIQRRVSYQYDMEGRITEKKKTAKYTFEGERNTFGCERYVYDIEGKLMHIVRVNASGKIVGFLNFSYDSEGHLSSKSNGKVTYRYEYNEQGLLSRKRKMTAGRILEEVAYDYRLYQPIQEVRVAAQ